MTHEWAIEARGLVKTFGTNRAVDGVNLLVETGTATVNGTLSAVENLMTPS